MTIEKINDKVAQCEAVLWKWSQNTEGNHPVKIRVTFNRKSKYYSAEHEGEKIFVSTDQWKAINGKNPRANNRLLADSISLCLSEAKKAVRLSTRNGKQFTFGRFENNYINKTASGGFIARFEQYTAELLAEGRTGSYIAYSNALSAFKAFRDGKELSPAEVTVQMLKDFETWLRKPKTKITKTDKKVIRKAGPTTVAMYMRAVKVVYNLMADEQPELKQDYPFAKKQNERNKYQIPAGSGDHKGEALSADVLKSFIDIKTESGTPDHAAKLTFLFSFFCQGMNLRDIANLRYKNIFAEAITYKREKTKRTANEDRTKIEIPLEPEIKEIIVELGNDDKQPENFVFPILNDDMSAIEKDKAVRQFIKITNKWLKYLCEQNNLPVFTTYSARHSYASLLKAQGRSIEMIRELLGHGDVRTTENYLRRFDLDKKKEANQGVFKILKSA